MKNADIDNKNNDDVVMSRFIWESYNASHERTVKRLLMALLITILLMVGTNMAWLYVWNQYDFSSETYTIENGDEGNALLGSGSDVNGVINNGNYDQGEEENNN